ncbi:MAG: hypothetical protein FWE53_01685 [Firmicutes bacterium]|nr:hypothetical protein [Bacillota bacterium]
MKRKFKVRKELGWFAKLIRFFVKTFKAKIKLVNLNDSPLPDKCIIISNHNGAGGPVSQGAYLGKYYMPWGAHQMCEGFISRWKYLYYVFYRQKLGWKKPRAFVVATLFGLVAGFVYASVGVVPVYYDDRLRHTFEYSIDCLNAEVPVLIFPEDSSKGYNEKIEKLWPGFLQLAKIYYTKHGIDLPIYTVHYTRANKKQITIGKPMYYRELAKTNSKEEILKLFLDYMNSLNENVE